MKLTKKLLGFTIVEMIIYMGLLAILTIAMTHLFSGVLEVQLESEATSAVESDSRYLYQRLAYDIGRASEITTPAALGDTTNTLTLLINAESFSYSLNDSNLVLTNTTGTHALNSFATGISNLTFRKMGYVNGVPAVLVNFTVTSVTERPSGPETKNVQTTISLR